MLAYDNLWPTISGIMLTGGSAFGLEAALGAIRYLEELGMGVDLGSAKLPLVPAAVINDLGVGSARVRPIHTNVNGDTLFATGLQESPLRTTIDLLGAAAAEAVAGAVIDAVRSARQR